jgi:hypothetical protein
MKLLGDKKEKAPTRAIQPDRLRDIKTEVGEDTKALLRDAAATQKKATRREAVKQVSLVEEEEKPSEPAAKPAEASLSAAKPAEAEALDPADFEIIKVKKLPDMSYMIEVRAFEELRKVGKAGRFINCFDDGTQKTYFVGNYFYTLDKRRP